MLEFLSLFKIGVEVETDSGGELESELDRVVVWEMEERRRAGKLG